MKNIVQIIKLSKPLHNLMLLVAVLIIFSVILNLISPILSKLIVDEIVNQIQNKSGDLSKLIQYVIFAFAASLSGLIIAQISDRLGDHLAGELKKFLTEKFYDKAFTLGQSYYDSQLSGKIVNQLVRGIDTIQRFVNGCTNFILPTFLQSIVIVAVLARYNYVVAIVVGLLFPIYILLSHRSTQLWGKEEQEKNRIDDLTRGRITEVIGNMSLVKSFTKQLSEFNFVSKNLADSNRIYARQSSTFHKYDFFRGLALQVTLFCVNIFVFWNAFEGKLSLGEVVLVLQMVNQARIPLFAMSFILTQIQMAEAGSKEYLEILALKSDENYRIFKEKTDRINSPTIEFKKVDFSYEEGNTVLSDVNFKINKNESVALVGHSGAGKSTIINLILKFYNPTHGNLFLSDKNYKDIDHSTIRNNISLVFQENELFSTTIRDNVAYGGINPSENDVVKALKLANAYDFVMKFPKGLNSEIGERGVKLSGGQKQRIQIARAILKDAPILILDEATSSLDAKSEKEVQDALENLMKKKLVIVIAHRFSTIQNVDKIIVLDHGKIVDYGNPQELSNKKGIYSELLKYQVEGNKKLLEKFELF